MLKRLTITFEEGERTALQEMAREALRDPKTQVRFLVREEAQRRGLIPADALETKNLAAYRSDKLTRDDQNPT